MLICSPRSELVRLVQIGCGSFIPHPFLLPINTIYCHCTYCKTGAGMKGLPSNLAGYDRFCTQKYVFELLAEAPLARQCFGGDGLFEESHDRRRWLQSRTELHRRPCRNRQPLEGHVVEGRRRVAGRFARARKARWVCSVLTASHPSS